MIQAILILIAGFSVVVIGGLIGQTIRAFADERHSKLTDEQKGVTWVEGKDGKPLPLDSKEGHIRLEEYLK